MRFVSFHVLTILIFASPGLLRANDAIAEIETIAKKIDPAAVATLHIPDFQDFLSQVEGHSVFASPRFLGDIGIVLEKSPELAERWEHLSNFLHKIHQLHIVLWKEDNRVEFGGQNTGPLKSEFTGFLLLVEMDDSDVALKNVLDFASGFFPYPPDQEKPNGLKRGTGGLPESISTEISNNWVVIGNSKERVAEFLEDNGGNRKSLYDDRRFVSALVEFKEQPTASVFIFARPHKFETIFSESWGREEDAKLEQLNELSSAGMTVRLSNNTQNVLINSFVSHTAPTIGLARFWEASRPLPKRLPGSCFKVLGVSAEAWDMGLLEKATRENYDDVHGKGAFDEIIKNELAANGQKTSHRFDRSSSRYLIRYESEIGLDRSFGAYRVDDYEGMKKYLFAKIAAENARRPAFGEVYVRQDDRPKSDPDAIVFGLPYELRLREWERIKAEIEQRPNAKKRMEHTYRRALKKTGKTIEELGVDLIENEGWLLTRDWLLSGDVSDMVMAIDAMNGDIAGKNEMEPLEARIKWLSEMAHSGMPSRIESGKRNAKYISSFFYETLKSKYGEENEPFLLGLFEGVPLEKLKKDEDFEGDVYDIATVIVYLAIYEPCSDVVITREKEKGGKLRTTIGVFFGDDE